MLSKIVFLPAVKSNPRPPVMGFGKAASACSSVPLPYAFAPRPCPRQVSVKLGQGEVVDGYERRLPGLGMPRRSGEDSDGRSSRGDLVVHFEVVAAD